MNESLDVAMCEGDLLFLNITQAFLLSDVHLESPRHEYANQENAKTMNMPSHSIVGGYAKHGFSTIPLPLARPQSTTIAALLG
jgi:hypothetical protein